MRAIQQFTVGAKEAHATGQMHDLSALLPAPKQVPDMWDGVQMLAQYACDAGFLVMYDYPISFENGPNWLLFDRNLRLLDEGGKAVMYDSTDTSDITVDSPSSVQFQAHGWQWRLCVLAKPVWRIGDLGALFLPVLRKRWFVLKRLERLT